MPRQYMERLVHRDGLHRYRRQSRSARTTGSASSASSSSSPRPTCPASPPTQPRISRPSQADLDVRARAAVALPPFSTSTPGAKRSPPSPYPPRQSSSRMPSVTQSSKCFLEDRQIFRITQYHLDDDAPRLRGRSDMLDVEMSKCRGPDPRRPHRTAPVPRLLALRHHKPGVPTRR